MHTEQRTSSRKILKVKAKLMVDGAAPMPARTVDISSAGMSISVDEPCRTGLSCSVGFELPHDGKIHPINARAKIAYCILSGGQFKVGLSFQTLDPATSTVLSKFLR